MTIQPIEHYKLDTVEQIKLSKEFAKYYLRNGKDSLKDAVVVCTRPQGAEGFVLTGWNLTMSGEPVERQCSIITRIVEDKALTYSVGEVKDFVSFLRETQETEGYTVPPALFAFLEADTNKLRSVCWDGSSWYAGLVEV